MNPPSEKHRRREQTARLPGHWRRLGPKSDRRQADKREALMDHESTESDY